MIYFDKIVLLLRGSKGNTQMHLLKHLFQTALLICLLALLTNRLVAQSSGKTILFTGAVIHTGNGEVIENGMVAIQGGKIIHVGKVGSAFFKTAEVIELNGKHVYPGLIALCNYAGLNEIDAAKPTHDFAETGELNPNVRSLIAYNCDSRILPTLLCNGVVYTQPTPQGGVVSGSSSLMTTSCSNWQDGVVCSDIGLHINWPEFIPQARWSETDMAEAKKHIDAQLNKLKTFFSEAKVYSDSKQTGENKFDAVHRVFSGKQKVFVSASLGSSIIEAVLFFKSLGVSVVWVGAKNALAIIPFLKENRVAVVLQTLHRLPTSGQAEINEPFTEAASLAKAGIVCCISNRGSWEVRNLPFNAGTAAAYGLNKEEALMMITQNAAQILGVDSLVGSLQNGRLATMVICSGDLLNMAESKIERVFISGVEAYLADNPQLQLYKKFDQKYFGQ